MQQLLACYDSDDEKEAQQLSSNDANQIQSPKRAVSESIGSGNVQKKSKANGSTALTPTKSVITGDELPRLPDDLFGGITGQKKLTLLTIVFLLQEAIFTLG